MWVGVGLGVKDPNSRMTKYGFLMSILTWFSWEKTGIKFFSLEGRKTKFWLLAWNFGGTGISQNPTYLVTFLVPAEVSEDTK
jgi:hypothetical protein